MVAAFRSVATGEWLDFAGSVGIEQRSPLFDADSVPGTLSYQISVEDTPRNRRLLGFPAVRSRAVAAVPPVAIDLYFDGLLYRAGLLTYVSAENGQYSYRFEADADALGTQLDGRSLADALANAEVPFSAVATAEDYALGPIRNRRLYDGKSEAWGEVANYFTPGGFFALNSGSRRRAFTPCLRLIPLLRRALAAAGYALTGAWANNGEILQLVVASRTTLDLPDSVDAAPVVALARHAPTVSVSELLVALQKIFCLGYLVDTVQHTVEVVALRDVVADATVLDRGARVRAGYRDSSDVPTGFLLAYTLPDGDEQLTAAPVPWASLAIGDASEEIRADASTLVMVREPDPVSPGRSWLVPAWEQPGRSAATDLADDTNLDDPGHSEPIRLLFDRGLQRDSDNNYYPLLTSDNEDYAGDPIGKYTLHWDGAAGLYQQWHKPWLDFRAAARQEERDVLLSAGDVLTLDPRRKELVEGLRFLWSRVSIAATAVPGPAVARITYYQIAT